MEESKFVALLLFISATLEWGIEHYVKPFVDLVVDEGQKKIRKAIFVGLSGLAGVGIAFAFTLSIIHKFGGQGSTAVDRVVTGLLLAAGTETMHQLLKRLFPMPNVPNGETLR